MSRNIIGLIGRKQTGKDTVADFLVEELGYTRIAFADTLREIAYGTNPIVSVDPLMYYQDVIDTIGYEAGKEQYPELRRFLQNLGTEGIRSVDPTFWVDKAYDRISLTDGDVVITDVRFWNELNAVRKLGGTLVRVLRPGFTDVKSTHQSEIELDGAHTDHTLYNSTTVENLQGQVMTLHANILLESINT